MKSIPILGLGLIGFLLWVVLASTADKRIEHTCQPVLWVGNVLESVILLGVGESEANRIRHFFEEVDYGCRFSVWRFFYGEEYEAKMKVQANNTEKSDVGHHDDSDRVILK